MSVEDHRSKAPKSVRCAVITISDDGPGLAAADLARVTRPFERGVTASTTRGSGLGLAIAQAIVRFHHGRIDLADAAPGLEVRVRIPANDSPNVWFSEAAPSQQSCKDSSLLATAGPVAA